MRPPRLVSVGLTTALMLTGCGSGASSASPAPHSVPPSSSSTVPSPTPAKAAKLTKVLVVIEENHSLAEMRAGMPYLARLSHRYGYATDWHALSHPSEPNYLGIAGGSTFGITNDAPPATNGPRVGNARSVFSQARHAGKTRRTYAQSMPRRCMASDAYPYAVKHNPWPFFTGRRAGCRRYDVSTASFARDARSNHLPNVGFLIPDLQHDAHDGSLATADQWLHHALGPVLGSRDFKKGRLVVVVTADEDDRTAGNVVLTSVLTPRIHHVVVTSRLTHYSLTRFIDDVLGVAPLRHARHARDLRRAFGL